MELLTINESIAINVTHVSKKINGRLLLDEINLFIPEGKIYGIIGPNGAGKSILLRVICGLVLPTIGEVTVFNKKIGRDVEFPPSLGALIDSPGLLPNFSGYQNLLLLSKIRNSISKERIRDTINLVGLDPYDRRPTKTYSTGMRQRLGIALAIMENPRLLILDEPITGLDTKGVDDIHEILRKHNQQGVTILITSHSREEIDIMCDASFFMNSGRLTQLS
ncbi:MAG: ATP-binding cassette domain-containing protein [Anaerolineaceae bacterium]|nr:ATP-binding cassette domain-containing protein [Anaerolineaceae bacterium]